jgi:hypothetical protein
MGQKRAARHPTAPGVRPTTRPMGARISLRPEPEEVTAAGHSVDQTLASWQAPWFDPKDG